MGTKRRYATGIVPEAKGRKLETRAVAAHLIKVVMT